MSSDGYDLVHVNVAIARHPSAHPDMAGFTSQIDAVNRLAAASPGFAWTPADGEIGDAVAVFGHPLALANISTWRSIQELWRFVYEGAHLRALARRREWFEPSTGPAYALWWVRSAVGQLNSRRGQAKWLVPVFQARSPRSSPPCRRIAGGRLRACAPRFGADCRPATRKS